MAIKINSWKPDTCDCVLHYSWDDSVPQEEIVTQFFAAEVICPDHAGLVNAPAAETTPTLLTSNKSDSKDERRNIIKQALDENKKRNLDKIKGRGRTSLLSGNGALIAPKPQSIADEETIKLAKDLDQHTKQVQEKYDAIFSTDFALAEGVYDAVISENKLKNKTIVTIIENKPELNDPSLQEQKALRSDIKYEWSWSGKAPNRRLDIILNDNNGKSVLTENDKSRLVAKLDRDRVTLG